MKLFRSLPVALALWPAGLALALAAPQPPQTTVGGQYNAAPPVAADGQNVQFQTDVNGNLKAAISGSVSSTISGFLPGPAYATPLAVTTISSRTVLPAGTVIVVYNTGASAAYVQLGNGSVVAATSNDVIAAGGSAAFAVGTNTNLAAITAAGTASLNISGGTGTPNAVAGGTATQGPSAAASGAWPVYEAIGGTPMSATNGLFVNPATGATFPVSITSLPLTPVNIQGSSSATYSNSHAVTGALAASLVLKPSAGNLYSINATAITGGAAGYLVVVNAIAAPAGGSAITPLDFCYFSAGSAGCSLSHGTLPANYGTGMVALITTAANPYTYTTGVDTAAISGDYQ